MESILSCHALGFSAPYSSKISKKARRDARSERRLQRAFHAAHVGTASRRQAAQIARLPLSTFQFKFARFRDGTFDQGPYRYTNRNPLTQSEEECIVELIRHYSDTGHPLKRSDVADSVECIVGKMPNERRQRIPFVNGRPGRKFLKNFEYRHKGKIKLGKPSMQEAQRWNATNAENLTAHFAEIEHLMRVLNIDSSRLANLDESGCTPNRETNGKIRAKTYHTRGRVALSRSPYFKNVHRVTIMPVIFASGEVSRPTFVVQGSNLPYRTVEVNGCRYLETLTSCLPRGSYVTMRKDVAGIEKFSFQRWATRFVEEVKDLTTGGRKVLLIYDGYRSHMGIKALEILKSGNIVAYALPAHTSGTTQPLDVVAFRSFKDRLKNIVSELSAGQGSTDYDTFDFLKMMREAYEQAFTRENVQGSFREPGLFPFNPAIVLGVPRPLSDQQTNTMCSVDMMRTMLKGKREARKKGLCIQPVVIKRGWFDTSKGLTLTNNEAMDLVRAQGHAEQKIMATKRLRESVTNEKERTVYEAVRVARETSEAQHLHYRVRVYGDPFVTPRPMKVRRAVAERRARERRIAFLRLAPHLTTPAQRLCLRSSATTDSAASQLNEWS